jgi:hypothetical protein
VKVVWLILALFWFVLACLVTVGVVTLWAQSFPHPIAPPAFPWAGQPGAPFGNAGSINGQAFAVPTGLPGQIPVVNASGTIVWTATPTPVPTLSPMPTPTPVPTASPGPTPDLSPTPIAGLPSCVPALLGRKGQVIDQNCAAEGYHATPLSTAGQGCQVGVYCGGAPSGTPTPAWVVS